MKKRFSKIIIIMMALAMLLLMSATVFADTWTYQDRISVQTGEPLYIEWDDSPATTGTLTKVDSSSTYYPSKFLLWVGDGSAPTVSNGSASYKYETEDVINGNTVTNKCYEITLTGAGTIKVTLDNTTEYTISNSAPAGTAPTAALPTAVNEFLPVGQFASGAMWGSIYSNGFNINGTTKKFLSGIENIGISLGAAGGYVTMDFEAYNTSSHPYGVDFIIYGNAFDGNPEAGAVKVFGFTSPRDTTGEWYDLTGSKYYDTIITNPSTNGLEASSNINKHNQDVTWAPSGNNINYAFTPHGTSGSPTNTFATNKSGWWPFKTTNRGYDTINGMTNSQAFVTDHVNVAADRSQIVYKDVCLVEDTNTNSDYQFGYFDIHDNGSNYGTAGNPYTADSNSNYGDGFDLSWAVDENGKPESLHKITKIRLYTAAALNDTGTAFDTTLTFGETSAEVCGVYGVNGSGTVSISPITVSYDNNPDHNITPNDLDCGTIYLTGGSIDLTFTSSATNVFVNGTKINSGNTIKFTVGSGETKYVQMISQNGTSSPYVAAIKLVGANS